MDDNYWNHRYGAFKIYSINEIPPGEMLERCTVIPGDLVTWKHLSNRDNNKYLGIVLDSKWILEDWTDLKCENPNPRKMFFPQATVQWNTGETTSVSHVTLLKLSA